MFLKKRPSRTSMPKATLDMDFPDLTIRSAKRGRKGAGRLSTQKKPKSSRHLMAWLLPAPEMPVTITQRKLSLGLAATEMPPSMAGERPFGGGHLDVGVFGEHFEQIFLHLKRRVAPARFHSLMERAHFNQDGQVP